MKTILKKYWDWFLFLVLLLIGIAAYAIFDEGVLNTILAVLIFISLAYVALKRIVSRAWPLLKKLP